MKNIKNKKSSKNVSISPVDKTNKMLMNICITIVVLIYVIPLILGFSSGLFKSSKLNYEIDNNTIIIEDGQLTIKNVVSGIYTSKEVYAIEGNITNNSDFNYLLLTFNLYDSNGYTLGRIKYEAKDIESLSKLKLKATYNQYDIYKVASYELVDVIGY